MIQYVSAKDFRNSENVQKTLPRAMLFYVDHYAKLI